MIVMQYYIMWFSHLAISSSKGLVEDIQHDTAYSVVLENSIFSKLLCRRNYLSKASNFIQPL